MTAELEVAVLTAAFTARSDREADLAAVLARYVVLARGEGGCRNVDLLASATESGHFLVIEKWDSPELARAHLDTELMTGMAAAAFRSSPRSPRSTFSTRSRPTTSTKSPKKGSEDLLLAKDVDRDLGSLAVAGAGLLADLLDARVGHRRSVPTALERGVGRRR